MKFSGFKIWDYIYPARCAVCDSALEKGQKGICTECRTKVKYIGKNVCCVCGLPVKRNVEKCEECRVRKHNFSGGRSALSYDFIGDSVFRFKYSNRTEYANFYAECIVGQCKEWIDAVRADAVIPVPLHKKRLAKRGYNQAEVLAQAISARTGIPCISDLCERTRNTVAQKFFDRRDRQINVKKAFIVRENGVKLNTIIVVDDIFTTGSTIDSLSECLLKAGVKRVYFLTITAAGT